MLQRTDEKHQDGGPWWREMGPSLLLMLAILLVEGAFAVVWTHYVGPLPVEP